MRPIGFPQQTCVQQPSDQPHSKNVTGVEPLPTWTDGEQCVSCWRMSWRERLSALVFGRVWVAVLSGSRQPPVYAGVKRSYFIEAPPISTGPHDEQREPGGQSILMEAAGKARK